MLPQLWRRAVVVALTFVPLAGAAADAPDTLAVVVAGPFAQPQPFSGGLAAVYANQRHGYVDKAGKVVVPATYSYARAYDRGLAFVLDKGRSLYIDARGNAVWSKP